VSSPAAPAAVNPPFLPPAADSRSLSDREIKDLFKNRFAERRYFEVEIREMFRRRLIPPEIAATPEELIADVKDLAAFIESARIVPIRADSAEIFSIDSAGGEFHVWNEKLQNTLPDWDAALLHEAIHRSRRQKAMEVEAAALSQKMKAEWEDRSLEGLAHTPPLRAQIRRNTRLLAERERQAYYGMMAMIAVQAGSVQQMTAYITDRLAPFAAKHRESVASYTDFLLQNPTFPDPVAQLYVSYYRLATAFTSGIQSEAFTRIVYVKLSRHPYIAPLFLIYARLPPSLGGLLPHEKYVNWAYRFIFGVSTDYEAAALEPRTPSVARIYTIAPAARLTRIAS
jgi:hypothetical protein